MSRQSRVTSVWKSLRRRRVLIGAGVCLLVAVPVLMEGRSLTTQIPYLADLTIGPRPEDSRRTGTGHTVSLEEYQKALSEVNRLSEEVKHLREKVETLTYEKRQLAKNFWYAYSIIAEKMASGLVINTTLTAGDEPTRNVYACVQYLLTVLGCYEGEINGEQKTTYAAVVKFQAAYGLIKVDGIIGQETWRTMVEGLGKQGAPIVLQPRN